MKVADLENSAEPQASCPMGKRNAALDIGSGEAPGQAAEESPSMDIPAPWTAMICLTSVRPDIGADMLITCGEESVRAGLVRTGRKTKASIDHVHHRARPAPKNSTMIDVPRDLARVGPTRTVPQVQRHHRGLRGLSRLCRVDHLVVEKSNGGKRETSEGPSPGTIVNCS